MSDGRSFVIVGVGMAGARVAASLRAEGFQGRVVLLGEEHDRPHDRVPLHKNYLRSEPGYHRPFVHDEGYNAEHDIELRLDTRAASIDVPGREVVLECGERLAYDRLLLTTGADPRLRSRRGALLAPDRRCRSPTGRPDGRGADRRRDRGRLHRL